MDADHRDTVCGIIAENQEKMLSGKGKKPFMQMVRILYANDRIF